MEHFTGMTEAGLNVMLPIIAGALVTIALMLTIAICLKVRDLYRRRLWTSYAEGYDEGFEQGRDIGYDEGENAGIIQGRNDLQEEMAVNEMLEDIDIDEGISQLEDHLRSQGKKD